MITVTTAEGKPQHLWVTLPDTGDTFQVIVAGTVQTTSHRFDGQGRPVHTGRVVPLRRRHWRAGSPSRSA
jgi:hypothetical protein